MRAAARSAVFLGTLSFAVFAAGPPLLLSFAALNAREASRPDATGDFLMAAYFVTFTTSLCSIGFLIPTALTGFWRRLAPLRAVVIAGALGLVAPIFTLLVAALTATAVLPLFQSARWLATAILYGLPGVILGMAAPGIAQAWAAVRPAGKAG